MPPRAPASTLRTLVAGLVDYAGLFPPAALSMADAVAAYAGYQDAPEAWMLGRFVVPVSRLHELEAERARVATPTSMWRLAVLTGAEVRQDIVAVNRFNAAHAGEMLIDVVEAKAATVSAVRQLAGEVGTGATLYVELPLADEPRPLLQAVHAASVRAKVRTGGLTPEAFPTSAQLARFIARCTELGVPFKATAGLHHPLRAEYRLTYDADAQQGTMFGFLNVFAAAAFSMGGMSEAEIMQVLEERDPRALEFGDAALRWREHELEARQVVEARRTLAVSFGSCSFREPVDDLHQLGYL